MGYLEQQTWFEACTGSLRCAHRSRVYFLYCLPSLFLVSSRINLPWAGIQHEYAPLPRRQWLWTLRRRSGHLVHRVSTLSLRPILLAPHLYVSSFPALHGSGCFGPYLEAFDLPFAVRIGRKEAQNRRPLLVPSTYSLHFLPPQIQFASVPRQFMS